MRDTYRSLISNRSFAWTLVRLEIRERYAGSIMGLFWTILSPALTIAIFVVIFANVLGAKFGELGGNKNSYVVYLCCGILPWNALQAALARANTAFLDHGALIKRVLFPRPILVAQVVIASILDLLISLALFIPVLFLLGYPPGISILVLPAIIMLQMLFCFGAGLLLSTLSVFLRDLTHLVGILLHMWFWMTPIVYPLDILPERLASWMAFNPLTSLITLYRDVLMLSAFPHPLQVLVFAVMTSLVMILGTLVYGRLKDEIPDEV